MTDGNNDSDSDDWEDDNVPAYDPTQKALQNNILPQGLTPAQRAEYRVSRRQGDLPEFMKKETDPWDQPDPRAPPQPLRQPQRQSPRPVKQNAAAAGIENTEIPKNQNGTGKGKSKPPGKWFYFFLLFGFMKCSEVTVEVLCYRILHYKYCNTVSIFLKKKTRT